MESESFEDEEVAEILNKNFVSIKVDREERPDIDSIYMTACQALTDMGLAADNHYDSRQKAFLCRNILSKKTVWECPDLYPSSRAYTTPG